eukprot:gene773-824_t
MSSSGSITREQGILYGYLIFTVGIVYLYFTSSSFHDFVTTWNEYYESALLIPTWNILPTISFLDFVGSVFVCKRYRSVSHGDKSWFEVFLACILLQFGGTTLIALLLGQVPSWILSRSAIPGFVVAWWLTFFSPDDFFYRHVSNNDAILFVLGIFNAISSGHAVTSWGMDKSYGNKFHNGAIDYTRSYFLNILVGTVAATGGGILGEVFNFFSHSRSFTLRHKSKFFEIGNYSISAGVNRSFWLAVIYYLLISDPVNGLPVSWGLPKNTAHGVIALLQISAYLQSKHIPQLDIYQEFSNFVLDHAYISTYYTFTQPQPENEEHEKND